MFSIVVCDNCGFVYTKDAPAQDQIGKYYQSAAYISHTDNKEGLLNTLYQVVRKRALQSKRKLITGFMGTEQRRVLDYGCGTGAFLTEMQSSGWTVQGVEPDPGAREKASSVSGLTIAEPAQLSAFTAESFDVITLWHVLEHIHDLHATLDHFTRILTDDGLLVVAVPNHKSYDAIHYGAHWAAYDVPRHLYHFDPASMQRLMQLHGFKIIDIKPMWFDAFYVSLLSEQYRSGSAKPLQAFFNGIVSNIQALFNNGVCSSQIYVIRK